jgi:hypothetical protein
MTTNGTGPVGTDARSYAEYAAQFRGARTGAGVAVAGLLISLLADVLAIATAAGTDGGVGRNDTIALYVLAGAAAAVGLFTRSRQRPLDCFVLGVWLLALPSLGSRLWLAAQHGNGGFTGLQPVSEVLGVVTVVLLLVSLSRQSGQGGRSRPTGTLRVWIAVTVLAGAACYLGRTVSMSYYGGPTRGAAAVALIITVLVLLYGFRLPSHLLGGLWVLGWIAALILGTVTGSANYYWGAPLLARATTYTSKATNTYALGFLVLSAVLAIAYATRKDRTSAR